MKWWWIPALWLAIPGYVMAFRTAQVVRWETRARRPLRIFARWRLQWLHIDPDRPETWSDYRVGGFLTLAVALGLLVASIVARILGVH